MIPTELLYIIISIGILLVTPFLPCNCLMILDNIVIRILMVCLLIYVVQYGSTVTIIVFMAIAALFLERNIL